jgi:hypothetical protein
MPAEEIVLRVGAEGGSLTVYRVPFDEGRWLWHVVTNEVALYDLLGDDDDLDPSGALQRTSAESFEDAIERLDRYPWVRLYPLQVHKDYREAVLRAVLDRGGEREERRWRSLLGRESCFPEGPVWNGES